MKETASASLEEETEREKVERSYRNCVCCFPGHAMTREKEASWIVPSRTCGCCFRWAAQVRASAWDVWRKTQAQDIIKFWPFSGIVTREEDLIKRRWDVLTEVYSVLPEFIGHCSKMKILSSAKNGDERAATLQEPLNGSAPRSRPTTTIAPLEMLSLVRNITALVLFLGSAATLSPHAQGSSAQCFQDKNTSKRMLATSLPRQHREARACHHKYSSRLAMEVWDMALPASLYVISRFKLQKKIREREENRGAYDGPWPAWPQLRVIYFKKKKKKRKR